MTAQLLSQYCYLHVRKNFTLMISTQEQLEQAALQYGMLPFFANKIEGFSVEEMAAPGMLFADTADTEGCWEWKGPVIRNQTTAYGKFFRNKAGFVALELLPDFLNYRRASFKIERGSTEAKTLRLIKQNEGMTSTELKQAIFGAAPKKPRAKTLADFIEKPRVHRPSLEGALQRLQMRGELLIADFVYKYTAKGDRYGWGIALYSTPEIWFGAGIAKTKHTPEQSFEFLCEHLQRKLPYANPHDIAQIIST
jgi:hypothetical protein